MMGAPVIIWLRPGVGYVEAAAAAMARLEVAFLAKYRRPRTCNSTYRDYLNQLSMWRAWQAYVAGTGPYPGHSRALHPDESKHCQGLADDTNEWLTPGYIELAAEHGWIRTAANDPTERHHFEHQWWRDQHRNEGWPAGSGSNPFPQEEDDMSAAEVAEIKAHQTAQAEATRGRFLALSGGTPGDGTGRARLVRYAKSSTTGDVFALYANPFGGMFRLRVSNPAALTSLGEVAAVDRETVIWPHDIVLPDDSDGVTDRPGEFIQHARSAATGNVFALFRDNIGNQVRRLITDPNEIAAAGEIPTLEQRVLWTYAPTNQS